MTEQTQDYIQLGRTVYFSREDIEYYDKIDGITVLNDPLNDAVVGDITSSSHNKVIPLHALAKGIGSVIQKGNDKVLLYAPVLEFKNTTDSVLKITFHHTYCAKIPALIYGISNGYVERFRWLILPYSRVERTELDKSFYAAANHILVDMDFNPYYGESVRPSLEDFYYEEIFNPLAVVGVKQEYLFDITPNNIDPKKLCIVISKDFTKNPRHTKVYRAFVKNYLNKLHPDIDVMYANNVKDVCYKKVHIPTPIMSASRLSKLQNKVNLELHEIFKKRQVRKRAAQAKQDTTEDREVTTESEGEVEETHEPNINEAGDSATNTTIMDDPIEIILPRPTTTSSTSSVYSTE